MYPTPCRLWYTGAYGSPKLLMLSGIGDRAHLQEHGIATVVHSPHVGQHLKDHLATPLVVQDTPGSLSMDAYGAAVGIGAPSVLCYGAILGFGIHAQLCWSVYFGSYEIIVGHCAWAWRSSHTFCFETH